MAGVGVEIVDVASRDGGAEVRYAVRNDSPQTVWVVDDPWFVWREEEGRIELGRARVRMRPGVEPFGYFPPAVAKLEPGEQLERTIELTWPQRLSRIWNEQREVSPAPGEYQVVVRVGYGETPEPSPSESLDEGVEEPVLAWQHEAVSEPATLVVR